MKNNMLRKFTKWLKKHTAPNPPAETAKNCSFEPHRKGPPGNAPSVVTLDPHDMTKCDMCGEHKHSVRSRKTITVGLKSGKLRWKFCDECVAELGLKRMPKAPADADFLVYFDGEGLNVLARPQNNAAKEYLENDPTNDRSRWLGGALVTKESSVIPLVHKLIAARFNVIGEKSLRQTPRLYVHEGKHCLYTAGAITDEAVDQILKNAGKPN